MAIALLVIIYLAFGITTVQVAAWLGMFSEQERKISYYHDEKNSFAIAEGLSLVLVVLGWPLVHVVALILGVIWTASTCMGRLTTHAIKQRVKYIARAKQIASGEKEQDSKFRSYVQRAVMEVEEVLNG